MAKPKLVPLTQKLMKQHGIIVKKEGVFIDNSRLSDSPKFQRKEKDNPNRVDDAKFSLKEVKKMVRTDKRSEDKGVY